MDSSSREGSGSTLRASSSSFLVSPPLGVTHGDHADTIGAAGAAGLLDRLPYRFGFLVRDVGDHVRVRGASQVRQSLIDRRHADRIRRLQLEGDDLHYAGGQENTREYVVRKLLLRAGPYDSLRNSLGPARRLGLIGVFRSG
jgi:hypothetical protein